MELTKQKLEELYNSMSNLELCEKLSISKTTLIKLIKDNNIPLKGKGGGFAGGKDITRVRIV